MPSHCFQAINENPKIMEHDFSVKWNADVSNLRKNFDVDVSTSAKATEVLCDIQRSASYNMHPEVKFQYKGASSSSRR